MNGFPLEDVLGTDGVELGLDDLDRAGVAPGELRFVERRADKKAILESVFESSLRVAMRPKNQNARGRHKPAPHEVSRQVARPSP